MSCSCCHQPAGPPPSLHSAFYPCLICVCNTNAVHQRDSQEYLKSQTLEQMKERRKKEIIVERYEAKLNQEAEMLAYQAQRASESRQRSQGQRSRNPRGSGVCRSRSFPPNQSHYTPSLLPAKTGAILQPIDGPPTTKKRLCLRAQMWDPADSIGPRTMRGKGSAWHLFL